MSDELKVVGPLSAAGATGGSGATRGVDLFELLADDGAWYRLADEVPPLTDKLLLDLVNGLEVVDDHLQVRASKQGFVARGWDALTGKAARRQQNIDETLTGGLKAATEWLRELTRVQVKTDLGVRAVARTLMKTRDALGRLADRHDDLEAHVMKALMRLEARVAAQGEELQRQIDELGLMLKARDHINRVFAQWEARRFDRYPLLTQVFIVVETLFWGPLSLLPEEEVRRLYPEVLDRCVAQIHRRLEGAPHGRPNGSSPAVFVTNDVLAPLRTAPAEQKNMVRFMLTEASPGEHPVNYAMVSVSGGPYGNEHPDSGTGTQAGTGAGWGHPDNLPYVLHVDSLAERLMEEARSRLSVLVLSVNEE